MSAMTVIAPQLPFETRLVELPIKNGDRKENSEDDDQINSVYQIAGIDVQALSVDHMIPCMAYRFEIRRSGKFDVIRAEKQRIPKEFWSVLQKGITVVYNGRKLVPEMVSRPLEKG
jgi:ribonuclease Z